MLVMVGVTAIIIYLVLLMEFHKEAYIALDTSDAQSQIRDGRLARYNNWLWGLIAVSMMFVSAFRVGFVDTPVYRYMFDQVPTELAALMETGWDSSKEYGFTLFMAGLRLISDNSQILIIVTSILIIGIQMYLLKRYAVDIPFSLLMLFFLEFVDSMNGVRQIMVGLLFLLTIPLIKKRRLLSYLIVILLLSTMHMSAIICLPLYFILNKPVFHPLMLAASGIILAAYFYPPMVSSVVDVLFGSESKYADYFNAGLIGMSNMRMLVQMVPLALLVIYEIRKRQRDLQNQPEAQLDYQIFANMVVLNALLNLLATRLVLLSRLSIYVSFGSIIMVPYLLFQLTADKDYRLIKKIALIAYFIFFVYQLMSFDSGNLLIGIRFIFWEE